MTAPSYQFQFRIVDEATGQTVQSDYCALGDIDQFGACANVDVHVASMLRGFERQVRESYEHIEYGDQLGASEADKINAHAGVLEAV